MKNYILFTLALLGFSMNAQTVKTIKPKPNRAIVYLSGAEIAYSESLSLPSGSSEIIIDGVSPYTDENTISAFFKGGLVIDTKLSLRYPEPPKNPQLENKYARFIAGINDSLEELAFLMKDANNKLATYQKEKYLLLNNRLMRGEFSRDSLPLLKSTLDMLRQHMINVDEATLLVERKIHKYNKLLSALNERKTQYLLLQSQGTPMIDPNMYAPIYSITVTIETEQAVTGNLSLKYYVANAGWMPMYDIQAVSGKEKIQLVYRAQVYQNTGLDWKDITLTLSTSNPAMGNTKPVLSVWNLYFGYPNSYIDGMNKKSNMGYNNLNRPTMATKSLETKDKAESTIDDDLGVPAIPVFTVSDNFLRTEYEIKTRYSIASDNKAHNVIINNVEIPVTLAYIAVPKLDKDAFLMGKVVDWEDLNLIPGSARIYFDESYIGSTTIDPESTKDTMYINLGRDKSIIVKRQNIKEKCKETTLGEFRIVSKTIEITVRNTKGINLQFEVEDQIPVTTDPNIKITMVNSDDAIYNEPTGKLTWKMNIKSKDTKKVRFSYEIKYPKDKYISGI